MCFLLDDSGVFITDLEVLDAACRLAVLATMAAEDGCGISAGLAQQARDLYIGVAKAALANAREFARMNQKPEDGPEAPAEKPDTAGH